MSCLSSSYPALTAHNWTMYTQVSALYNWSGDECTDKPPLLQGARNHAEHLRDADTSALDEQEGNLSSGDSFLYLEPNPPQLSLETLVGTLTYPETPHPVPWCRPWWMPGQLFRSWCRPRAGWAPPLLFPSQGDSESPCHRFWHSL